MLKAASGGLPVDLMQAESRRRKRAISGGCGLSNYLRRQGVLVIHKGARLLEASFWGRFNGSTA